MDFWRPNERRIKMSEIIRKYLKDMKTSGPLSREQIRAEANIGVQLMAYVKVWSELANDCRNKTDKNNFAKYVLSEVEEIAKTIREEK
jgi:hypothetical protein